MELGQIIKSLRNENNLTQKDLADQLNVTAQAVSRWEQNAVEPSVDTLRKMADIFKVSLDVIMGRKDGDSKPDPVQQSVQQREVDTRRTIGVCESCNRPILEGENINRHRYSRHHVKILCDSCETNRNNLIRSNQEEASKKYRRRGFVWASLAVFITILIGLYGIVKGLYSAPLYVQVLGLIGISYALFSFIFAMIARNNFIADLFLEVSTWGLIKLPGVIFSLDWGGIIFLITVKIGLFLLSLVVGAFFFVVAFAISAVLSMFVFPFALKDTYIHPEKTSL